MLSYEQLQSMIENENSHVDRLICEAIDSKLKRFECVALLGPRQVGKTTLAKSYFQTKLGGVYRDLEQSKAKAEVGTGTDFFDKHKDRIIILDEIQECPNLFPNIKVHIDEQRFEANKNCRFLLLGSASLDLQRQTAASLTGRAAFMQMTGILLPELINSVSPKINLSTKEDTLRCYKGLTDLLVFRGGMPQSLFAESDEESLDKRKEFVGLYVQNDVEKYGLNVDKNTLESCLDYIAKENGQQFEIGTYKMNLKTSGQKILDSISALTQVLLVRLIDPWKKHNGQTHKVTKHSKVYIRDSGMLVSLLGIDDVHLLLESKHIGAIWESFVIESLVMTAQSIGILRNCFYYRTHKGECELDLILEFQDRKKWGIEIKHSEPKQLNTGNITAAERVGVNKRLVIHNGTNTYKVNGGFEAMPLNQALEAIRKRNPRLAK